MDAQQFDPGKCYPGVAQFAAAIEEFASMKCEDQARSLVFDYARQHLDPSDALRNTAYDSFTIDHVYVVQFTYILGNWKALVSTELPDGMYYEVTYDKRRGIAYLDPYKRFDHKEIAIPASPARQPEHEDNLLARAKRIQREIDEQGR